MLDQKHLFEFVVSRDFNLSIGMNCWILVAGLIMFLLWLLRKFSYRRIRELEIDGAEIGIGNQKIVLKPNIVDSQIAYKIWVELSTRKIGIPIELEKDVIVEIYDSWYTFFQITRELIKEIPVTKLKRRETRDIVKLSIDVLNYGVRPHLTHWQARFRRWYENELSSEGQTVDSPQDIQTRYPNYDDLTSDLIEINRKLIQYRDAMRKLAFGENVETNEEKRND